MNVLFIGDVFGQPGRDILLQYLQSIQSHYSIDATIVNGENAAGGFGITPQIAEEFFASGVDLITSGNHIWRQKEISGYLEQTNRLLRPHNMYADSPGSGYGIIIDNLPKPLAVINLIGRVFMDNSDCPFRVAEQILADIRKQTNLIVVDFHAEATSEKKALGWFLDGKVSAVLGTHTHVQTADEQILPRGTAFISDVGMTGPHESVIGVDKDVIIERFVTQMPLRFVVASGSPQIHGVILEIDQQSGRANSIKRLSIRDLEDIGG